MLEFLKRRLKSEKGAMDSILVTLLLILIGIAGITSLSSWLTTQTTSLKNDANTTLNKIIDE